MDYFTKQWVLKILFKLKKHALKPIYLGQFLEDMKNEMIYKESSQFINQRLIRTENTRVTIP